MKVFGFFVVPGVLLYGAKVDKNFGGNRVRGAVDLTVDGKGTPIEFFRLGVLAGVEVDVAQIEQRGTKIGARLAGAGENSNRLLKHGNRRRIRAALFEHMPEDCGGFSYV